MNMCNPFRQRYALIALTLLCGASGPLYAAGAAKTMQIDGKPVPVTQDGIHDKNNEAVSVLQNPEEAMKEFPRDEKGIVDWVKTIEKGHILPRAEKTAAGKMPSLDVDVIMKNTGSLPPVIFSHKQHTLWLGCGNCHDKIFKQKAGTAKITMQEIMKGQYCGVCHGKVSFPPTVNCNRCHSGKK
ncbi:MAG: cytochrome c3 family protein [Pseudomonadota bacterium]